MDRFRSIRPHALRPTALFSTHAARDVIRPGSMQGETPVLPALLVFRDLAIRD